MNFATKLFICFFIVIFLLCVIGLFVYIELAKNNLILFITFAIFCVVCIMVFVIRSFKISLDYIKQNIKYIENGDFDAIANKSDEISRLMAGACVTVQSLINDINIVIKETSLINESKFNGVFKETAIAINNIINNLRKITIKSSKAEENPIGKSHFFARMSHEIRTSTLIIIDIAQLQLGNRKNDICIQESFTKIFNSSQVLLGIANDILDLSKIESGKMTEDIYDTTTLITDIAQTHIIYLDSKAKKLNFIIDADENLPSRLKGDKLRIKQAVNNILTNAFKFTEKGKIELRFRRKPNPRLGFITFEITVKDTGIGIPDDILQKLASNGKGLGMSVVYNLMQLMDAEINIQSEVGVGTYVIMRIPQAISSNDIIGIETVENIASLDFSKIVRKVDYVDTNLYITKGFLNMYKLQIGICANGHEAVEKIKNRNTYDIIFINKMMTELDEAETAKILHNMGYSESIIALTTNDLIGHADIIIKNGFNGFISKPIDSAVLDKIAKKYVKNDKTSLANNPELIELFLKDINEKLTELEQVDINSLNDNAFEIIKKNAHSAAGILSCVNKPEIMNYARELEYAAREKNGEFIIKKLHDFIKVSRELMQEFRIGEFKEIAERLKKALEHKDTQEIENIFNDFYKKEWLSNIIKLMLEIQILTMKGDFSGGVDVLEGFFYK